MAVSVTATSLIRVAPGTVWKSWLALPQWGRWQPATVEASWTPGAEPWQQDSTFTLLRRTPFAFLDRAAGANARHFEGRVLSVSEGQLLAWELQPRRAAWFGPVLVESVRLTPAPSGTTVALTLTAHGLGPRLLGLFLRGPLQGQVEGTLAGLRARLATAERRQ